jgi:S-formylglutathione hydrolase
MELKSKTKSFGGSLEVYRHESNSCKAPMQFAVFLPPQAKSKKVPVLYWLSGLTCTEQNFIQKAGALRLAAEYGIALVVCDTSPRQLGIKGEDDRYDLGSGAGFYVDATEAPWAANYKMYSYVVNELPALAAGAFPIDSNRQGIFGHSMGGHGALTIALKNPTKFKSVSAFAPICAPSGCPWGEGALGSYLGSDRSRWADSDACLLVKKLGYKGPILIDQGAADEFLQRELHPELFKEACTAKGVELVLRYQEGYDHSYYFIATFIADHFKFHAEQLG